MRKDIIIGIDPDVDKNGVAYLTTVNKHLTTFQMKFGELLLYLQRKCDEAKKAHQSFVVIIEGGWLNKSNWHLDGLLNTKNKSLTIQSKLRLAASIGKSQGENHQRGLDIVEFCEHFLIPHEVVKPYVHDWGLDHRSKISKLELDYVIGTKLKRNNQEERDAALIAWLGANFPLRRSAKVLKGL